MLKQCNMFVTPNSHFCIVKIKQAINMRKILLSVMLALAIPTLTFAKEKKEEKKGSAIITIYSDLHSGFGTVNNDRGFNLDRAYIGYQYKLPHNLLIKAVMDFDQSDDVDDIQRVGFIKNAMVSWKHEGLTLNGGLISTTQFKTQEDFWGKRYVMKSFQDEYKFGSSADLAVSAAYKFCDIFSADVIVANGEGYKKVQVDDGLQYGAGLTLTPVKGFMVRAYGSYNEAGQSIKDAAQNKDDVKGTTNLAFFAGYKNSAFSLGAEYNWMKNTKFANGNDKSGASVYTTINLTKKINIYGRWDYLTSKDSWDSAKDGMAGMAGVEFKLGKYVKLSPNFRIWAPKADGTKNLTYAYLNASFAL